MDMGFFKHPLEMEIIVGVGSTQKTFHAPFFFGGGGVWLFFRTTYYLFSSHHCPFMQKDKDFVLA